MSYRIEKENENIDEYSAFEIVIVRSKISSL